MNRRRIQSVSAGRELLAGALVALAASASADTIAYWRFEGDGTTVPTDGAYVQDTNSHTAIQAAGVPVPDVSGNGNNLYCWDDNFTGHLHRAAAFDAPFTSVPLTGAANGWFIENSGGFPASFTWSSAASPAGTNLETWTSLTWTVEASIKANAIGGNQTFIGRDGNDVSTVQPARAPFYFQLTPAGTVRVQFVDAAGETHIAADFEAVVPGRWYHFAATCDGTTLTLWKRKPGGLFEDVGFADVSFSANPALANPGVDVNGQPWAWSVGRGRYGTSDNPNDDHTDRWLGAIDEVRISDVALPVSQLLAAFPTTPEDTDADGLPDAWESANFDGYLGDGPAGDYDFDYATNRMEYLAGTDPDDPDDWPDTDGDGINDGWETYYYPNLQPNSLAWGADADTDGDYNTNLAEFLANTDPTGAFSYPDEDLDWMNDGWEKHFFPEVADINDVLPEVDADGDLFSNIDEHDNDTDPRSQVSSPDTDTDGLPDGWEVKYFRVGGEDLASVIARQNGTGDPDTDKISNKLEYIAGTDPTVGSSANTTLGYWRFEEATTGDVPAGGNQQYLYPTSIQDSSGYGNHMMAWADYVRPNYSDVVPAAAVPLTGEPDTASLYFLRNTSGQYFVESVFSTPTAYLGGGEATLRTHTFSEFTIEASFMTTVSGAWQVPVCKLGQPVTSTGRPPFSLKIDTANKLRAGLIDASGTGVEIIGTTNITANSWYSAAVTATATELTLWLKKPGDFAYVIEGSLPISGAWYVPTAGPYNSAWNIGGGVWNNVATDGFQGNIDEVRISAVVLPESEFLFHEDGSPFDAWAALNIPDETRRGETDDADGDGTWNVVEFMLGLEPMDGSSFFAGTISGSTLTWPAADGMEFTIQRSTTLGVWENVATVTATGATATWTDLDPPVGKAFYRVALPVD